MSARPLPERVRILILGAGPTGLGAARRLLERGETDWLLLEATDVPGGLAGSVVDEAGYVWDMGGHIQFSHYDYFDRAMDDLLAPDEWIRHERESWVWIAGRFVPYPFQNNLRHLPREAMWECVRGLIRRAISPPAETPPANFLEWMRASFGDGICRLFMEPYNFKVWAYPPEELDRRWVGDRVAVVDLERAVGNVLLERDDVSWGPNAIFRFPRAGGTGEVWRRCAARLPAENLRYEAEVARVDTANRVAFVGREAAPVRYDALISTAPLDRFVSASDLADDARFAGSAALLRRSSTHVVGLGVRGAPPESLRTKCWMYFPEDDCPFYRVTVFSNYSPNNVPDIAKGWSLMCEVSESPAKRVDGGTVVEDCIRGALAARLVGAREDVVHTFHRRLPYGYPTPSLERDRALDFLLPALAERNVFSRGRFGAWKYEVSNQDHSMMQGVECADRILDGKAETTVFHPDVANAPRRAGERAAWEPEPVAGGAPEGARS